MKVAFTLISSKGWTGGSNYLRNLLSAAHEAKPGDIHPILFTGDNVSESEINTLRPFVSEIVRDKCFSQWSPSWIMRQFMRRVADRDGIVEKLFRQKNIDVVFHAGLFGSAFPIPSVNWIADFQHIHLPEMFSSGERRRRDRLFSDLSRMCSRLVLSSECAKRDFISFLPAYSDKAEVLRFVSGVPEDIYDGNPMERIKRYHLPEKFFHLPNQFWKHKNHIIVIEALKLLTRQKSDVFVVCTGNEQDYRNPGYFDFLKKEIRSGGIEERIALLGLVPPDNLYALMRQSVAILNPSLFEGWSTTVEEAKSIGKKVLLSGISVHREQSPPEGVFFDPKNPEDLAGKMAKIWEDTPPGPDHNMEDKARSTIKERTQLFVERFADILRKAVHH